MGFEQILQQVAEARRRAQEAAQHAQDERRRRREENDLWVNGGVNWNGFGLETLIKMVAERSSPAQLNALAGEWSRHGTAVSKASDDLSRALDKLMNFWTGTAADDAVRKVTTNARWIGELGETAQRMSGPIMDASGALRSAQDTMPGMPKNNWLGTAGGGAAAGFMVAGPIGAAFGAAIGGIASVFGFGSKKKKMKRKAVQTMQRYEGALLGIDQTTPQFGVPSDGSNPGTGPLPDPDNGIGRPGGPPLPPGAGGGGITIPRPPIDPGNVTAPSFAGTPEGRWQGLTGLTPGNSGLPGFGGGGGSTGGGLGTGPFGAMPGMGGRGAGAVGPLAGGRGGAAGRGGAGAGRGGAGRGGAGFPGGGMGGVGGRGDREYRGRGRFSKTGALGGGMGGGPAGRRGEDEEDGEHRRRVPIEEDIFASDLKAAPPVIGL
ncbi:WXG100 family type VII secretion target [Actinophytocola algeriensis]|uniref:PPE family protein n=1 Tax=Actinophytocola algeriensis TaxID=1768010 RepID=A0A7W7QEK3_9PSEU|nr:hypothetical protein [Actinophytocola algeriensis]MBB4912023.1 hypothetical protein [Actinophytocola algeriensis]MBE1477485.1 hypothetical protein [Actinophytocola algeriensis]